MNFLASGTHHFIRSQIGRQFQFDAARAGDKCESLCLADEIADADMLLCLRLSLWNRWSGGLCSGIRRNAFGLPQG